MGSAYRQAGKKDIQVGIDMSNVALVVDEGVSDVADPFGIQDQ